jgi:hypothetical protein
LEEGEVRSCERAAVQARAKKQTTPSSRNARGHCKAMLVDIFAKPLFLIVATSA